MNPVAPLLHLALSLRRIQTDPLDPVAWDMTRLRAFKLGGTLRVRSDRHEGTFDVADVDYDPTTDDGFLLVVSKGSHLRLNLDDTMRAGLRWEN